VPPRPQKTQTARMVAMKVSEKPRSALSHESMMPSKESVVRYRHDLLVEAGLGSVRAGRVGGGGGSHG